MEYNFSNILLCCFLILLNMSDCVLANASRVVIKDITVTCPTSPCGNVSIELCTGTCNNITRCNGPKFSPSVLNHRHEHEFPCNNFQSTEIIMAKVYSLHQNFILCENETKRNDTCMNQQHLPCALVYHNGRINAMNSYIVNFNIESHCSTENTTKKDLIGPIVGGLAGVVGLAIFIFIIIYMVKRYMKSKKIDPDLRRQFDKDPQDEQGNRQIEDNDDFNVGAGPLFESPAQMQLSLPRDHTFHA